MRKAVAEMGAHGHDWRVAEVVFDDGVAVRQFECWCGATDMDTAA
ncbi:hypothetical protein P5P86_10320 [Nocardioides sp. BP30]|nr:hypothetical protein [Nocardioides sp. BP30]WGL50362.1 hypothetical protein P5P86_10320 [Nocardioides sp. BP30]